ncbi:MAG: 50S ribosomal protein L17 [Chloroflexi bacterium]|nr:50S ribosomal protein L17 [Chloroflexota bacterium]
MAGRKLGRQSAARRALFRGLTHDLLQRGHVVTTEAKAKEVRAVAERIITLGKRKSLHARRQALAYVPDEDVVAKVFSELADRYAERQGGYTRLTKLGLRVGDGAPQVRLDLV